VNDKGPAENLKLTFVEHDHQFNGDTFEAALDERLEKILLNSRMLEFFPLVERQPEAVSLPVPI
jgi:hypothetical protein